MAEAAKRSTTEVIAKLYDGKLRLERRNGASVISARTFLVWLHLKLPVRRAAERRAAYLRHMRVTIHRARGALVSAARCRHAPRAMSAASSPAAEIASTMF